MSGTVTVLRPGMQTTVQDLGRWGLQSRGVSVAGPMDPWSHRLANVLVGNPPDAATLELTLVGPELRFDDSRSVALVGGEFDITLDDRAVAGGTALRVAAGDRLRVGRRSRGARGYLAVAGGIDVPTVLGSRATHVPSGVGGCHGRQLIAGDLLALGVSTVSPRFPSEPIPILSPCVAPGGTARVRVLPGPQRDRFSDAALDQLQAASYRVSQDSNRMGFRLEGPVLAHADGREMLSDATPFGVVQVPRLGQPILLMADRQTTGGYPKIATVISADIGIAGQLAPGDFLQFAVCDERTALAELQARERALVEIERHGS